MAPLRKTRPDRPAGDAGTARRASGTLESAILAVLWEAGEPLSPGEVRERLTTAQAGAQELAYTTVVTILTRLFEKNALVRERDGRAYRYAPVADEAGLAARRLAALLDAAPDRDAVLSRFVQDLPDRDEQLLRLLLGARVPPPGPDAGSRADAG
jgi:predicted transcriptional regulator